MQRKAQVTLLKQNWRTRASCSLLPFSGRMLLLASEERVWTHGMSVELVVESREWKIILLHVTGLQQPSHAKPPKRIPVALTLSQGSKLAISLLVRTLAVCRLIGSGLTL